MSVVDETPALQEQLDNAAPRFPARVAQRINRRAMVFLVAMLALLGLAIAAIWRGPDMASRQPPPAKAKDSDPVGLPAFPGDPIRASSAGPAASPDRAGRSADATPFSSQDDMVAELQRRPAILPEAPLTDLHPPMRAATPAQRLRERRSQRQSHALAMPGADESGDPAIRAWTDGLKRSAALMAAAADPGASGSAWTKPEVADKAAVARRLPALDRRLLQGTYIRCVLNNRIITDVPGFAACTVSEPVYSGNGRRLLLPPGTRILGSYSAADLQHERLAMVWDRIVTPDGVDIELANPGVDSMGSAGHPGQYTAHWGPRIGSAVMVSLLSDAFKYAAEQNGPRSETLYPATGAVVSQPFESNTAKALQMLAEQSVEAGGRRPPTLTLMAGARLNVYVVKDIDFSGVDTP